MDNWVATNCPRLFAFEVSETHVGTVPVFMPFPIPWTTRVSKGSHVDKETYRYNSASDELRYTVGCSLNGRTYSVSAFCLMCSESHAYQRP